jgi:putative FmdB family regulatory protein
MGHYDNGAIAMPMYEYACRKCEHTFEALVFDGDEVECPQCKSDKLQRLISVPGLPQVAAGSSGGACGDPSLPPCGAPWCQRKGA